VWGINQKGLERGFRKCKEISINGRLYGKTLFDSLGVIGVMLFFEQRGTLYALQVTALLPVIFLINI
jgi:hypothetical protein